jgi:hypothetical protein
MKDHRRMQAVLLLWQPPPVDVHADRAFLQLSSAGFKLRGVNKAHDVLLLVLICL